MEKIEIPEDPKKFWALVIKRLAENAELKGKIKAVVVPDTEGKRTTVIFDK